MCALATYSAAASERGIFGRQLAANTEDVVNLQGNATNVEVRYWPGGGSSPIYFRVNTSASVALPGGSGDSPAFELFPGESMVVPTPGSTSQVRLISAGTATYSVSEV